MYTYIIFPKYFYKNKRLKLCFRDHVAVRSIFFCEQDGVVVALLLYTKRLVKI
jgi:hypothetical protein